MKKLSIVIHSSMQQELADYLRSLELNTFMFSHIEEHSRQLEQDAFLSERDKVVGYVPQVRVDIILENEQTKSVLQELRKSACSIKCKGTYWITNIEEAGNL